MIQIQGIDIAEIVYNLSQITDVYSGAVHIFPTEKKVIGYGEWSISLTPDTYSFSSAAGQYDFKAVAQRDIYWSDDSTTKDTITTESLFTWDIEGNGFSVDNAGVVSVTANTGTSIRNAILTVTYQGASDSANISQSGGDEQVSYTDWEISVSADPKVGDNTSFTSTITASATRTKTVTVNGQAISTTEETAEPKLTSDIGTFNGNVLTIPAWDGAESRTITVTASHASKTATCTITQSGSSSLLVDPTSLAWAEYDVAAKTVNVKSNDDWQLNIA